VPITSLGNSAIKEVRALRQRKERDRTGLCLAEGIRAVGEALQVGAGVETIIAAPDLLRSPFARELIAERRHDVRYLEVSPAVFASLSAKDGPQGLAAVVRQRWESLEHVHLIADLCWVVLDGPQDPGNLGTIARTSDAVGGSGLILLGQTADPYDPAALRASMGAMFSQRLVRAGRSEFASWKRRHAHTVVGTSGAAATEYRSVEYRPPLLLLMGSEREGLSAEQQATCDLVVRIPMVGRSDSLNLAVATGLLLYEVFHQQRDRH
jgi:TrmH family RNA methyltransferase